LNTSILIHPIGIVENDVEEMLASEEIASRRSRIRIHKPYVSGLLGIEEAERILVLFFFHRVNQVRLRLHPRDDISRPLRGVFATRTQYRPNPIGVTVARLISVDGNVLEVEGLDAMNGSPVIDIKPYVARFDDPSAASDEPVSNSSNNG